MHQFSSRWSFQMSTCFFLIIASLHLCIVASKTLTILRSQRRCLEIWQIKLCKKDHWLISLAEATRNSKTSSKSSRPALMRSKMIQRNSEIQKESYRVIEEIYASLHGKPNNYETWRKKLLDMIVSESSWKNQEKWNHLSSYLPFSPWRDILKEPWMKVWPWKVQRWKQISSNLSWENDIKSMLIK